MAISYSTQGVNILAAGLGPERKVKMKICLSNPRISSPTASRSHTCGGVGINNCSLVSERYSATSDLGAQTCQQNIKNLSLDGDANHAARTEIFHRKCSESVHVFYM